MLNNLFWLVPVGSILALGFAYYFFKQMMKADEGTDTMKKIAQYVREGAMAYLKQQYKVVTIVFVILTIIFAILAYVLKIQNPWVPFGFSNRRFLQWSFGFLRYENSYLCFGTYCQCCPEITESWSQGSIPFRCCYGSRCCRSWIA